MTRARSTRATTIRTALAAASIEPSGTSRHVRLAMIASRSNAPGHAIGSASVQPPMESRHASMWPPMRWRQPELRTALIVSWLLVVARSLVYTVFSHAHFDSDQAIVGLMAKHLSEGRAFPLFFYGQSYMLAVEAWLAVPFFWMAGPTVAALRASLILT